MMSNTASPDAQNAGSRQGGPGIGGQPDVKPLDPSGRTEQGAIDDQGGGTGLPAEARKSPVGTPIGGPASGSAGAGGESTGLTLGSDPG